MDDVETPPRPRSRRAIPWGFLGMLALVGAIEQYAIRGNLAFSNSTALCWAYTGKHVGREAPGRDILCFGDSMAKFGLNHRVIEARTGRRTSNLAVVGGSPASSYFLLRRAIDAGARPSTVVVDFCKDLLRYEPSSTVNVFPWSSLLDLRETFELGRAAHDADLFGRILLGRLLPSARCRFEIRAAVMASLEGKPSGLRQIGRSLLRNLNRNQGDLVFGKHSFEDTGPMPENARGTSEWKPVPVNVHFVRKFLALAEAHKIRIVWVLLPVSPGFQAAEEFLGNEGRFETLVRTVQRRYPNLSVLDARHPGFGASYFHDAGHLDRDGSLAISNAVADVLGSTDRERWVTLPASRKPENTVPLEDLDQTWMAVHAPAKNVQRR